MRNLILGLGVLQFILVPVMAFSQSGEGTQTRNNAILRGHVTDAVTGEPVGKVKVGIIGTERSALTDDNGDFVLQELTPGDIELYVTSIGFGLVKKKVSIKGGEEMSVSIPLNQEAAPIREEVTVTAGPFSEPETNVASAQGLTKAELSNLSTVLVSDPVRAAQSLPGVVANDDLRTDFAFRGAGVKRIGIYLDGLLLPQNPVHTKAGDDDAGQISILNADSLAGVSLLGGAFPAKYGDATGGVLQLETKDGNRVRAAGRVAASLLSTSATFDGPFARKRGTWLVSARKSYLGYIVGRLSDDDPNDERFVVDFTDANAKVIYDLAGHHQIGFTAVWGTGKLESNREPGLLSPDDVNLSRSHEWVLYGHWTFTPNSRFVSQTRAFGLGGSSINENISGLTLLDGNYRQFGVRNDINYLVTPSHRIEAGLYVRSMEGRGVEKTYSPIPLNRVNFNRRTAAEGFYAQDTWSARRSALALTAGIRIDRFGLTGQTLVMPRASLSFTPFESTRLHLGWGRHAQFPGFDELFGVRGNPNLRAEWATHFNAGIEHLFGTKARLIAEAYDREDRGLFFTLAESLIQSGQPVFVSFPQRNALKGYARGIEVMLQRRSTNRLTGWISYSYSKTRLTDVVNGFSFPSDFDQRHTGSVYGSYRLNNTWNLSAQWRHGSGLPILGFFRELNGQVVLGTERNRLRLPAYSRVDFRAKKAFYFRRSKLTLSGEVLNLLNRGNVRQDGRGTEKLLPLVPSVGIAFEF